MDMPFRISEIIYRHIIRQITPEEKTELHEWLEQSERHREMFREFCRAGYTDERAAEHLKFDPQRGYLRFLLGKVRVDNRRLWQKVVAVAALFVCLLGGGYLWFYMAGKEKVVDVEVASTVIEPGKSRAVLILGNGERIDLVDSLNFEVADRQTRIAIHGNRILYPEANDSVNRSVNTICVPRGGEYKLVLSDGTKVWLNAETKFVYPVNFCGDLRKVEVEGEAYFEVAKDKLHPFVVTTEGMDVKVLGTSFNVKAYGDEVKQTTLVEGKVEIRAAGRMVEMAPGDQVSVSGGELLVQQVEALSCVAWKDRRFSFADELLESVIKKLERWYDVHFFIQNDVVRGVRFTGTLPKYENIDKILKMLELTTHIRFVQKGRTVMVESEL